jgi:hypothetical protein
MSRGRRFELTIGVFLPEEAELPVTFRDWIDVAGLCHGGASPTTLERVVETNHPPASDVVGRRRQRRDSRGGPAW